MTFRAFIGIITFAGLCVNVYSLDETIAPGPISDSTAPEGEPILPDFVIKSTVIREIDVVEAPPMAGLAPVEGTISATVHLVEDPKLPDPLSLPPSAPSGELPLNPAPRQISPANLKTLHYFLSVTVYDHTRSLLCFAPSGHHGAQLRVWSNVDFNHLAGTGRFHVQSPSGKERRYLLVMGVGNEDTVKKAELLAAKGIAYQIPQFPQLPAGTASYVFEGMAPDPQSEQFIKDLHAYYSTEGARLAEDYARRSEAHNARKAELLANPPVPKDVTIHFWERDKPLVTKPD